MSDTYDATYQAVRQSIGRCDVGAIVREAVDNWDLSHQLNQIQCSFQDAAEYLTLPSVLYRPALTASAAMWHATLGDLVGHGASPAEAMADFNNKWYAKELPP